MDATVNTRRVANDCLSALRTPLRVTGISGFLKHTLRLALQR